MPGQVSEDRAAFVANRNSDRRAADAGGELVAAQRDERGRDVTEGDFAEMTAVCRPVLNERPNGSEVA